VEDQPTDTSDLTDAGAGTPDGAQPGESAHAATAPVGKRGRHRTFRPRAVSAQEEATPEITEATAAEPESAVTEGAQAPAVEPESAAVDDADAGVDAKPARRRRWFRGRETEVVADDEPVAAPAETSEDDPADPEVPGPADDDVRTAERKPVGRRLAVAVAVAAALFVVAGAVGGATLQPYLADRVVAGTKIEIAQTAKDAITTLFTYTPDDMEQLPARSARYLGGDLKDAYAKQVDALAATNKQSQIHRNAQVVGAAVESLNGDNATAMVYANISYTSAETKDVPRIFLVAYRLTMEREGGTWLITSMPWITSKDLTRL
jgi:Mce-associated membrane protein